jgi:hypothetical protein
VVQPFNGITTTTLDNLISNSNTDIKNDKKNILKSAQVHFHSKQMEQILSQTLMTT